MADKDGNHPREVELKFSFAPDVQPLIDQHPALQPPRATPPEVQQQVSTYYDTPDFALYQSKLTLRVRVDGHKRIQTLKAMDDGQGAATSRGEWEWPVKTERPELGLLAGTPASAKINLAHGATLKPVFVTDIQRTLRTLELDGGSIAEVAIDEGTIRAGNATEAVSELELELKAGPIRPLYHLAIELSVDIPLRIGGESKAARGYHLRTGQPPEAEKAHIPELDRTVHTLDALRQIVATALGGLLANQPAALFGDPEGVHQMRVSIRHLRAAQMLFQPYLEPHASARFESEMRRFGRVLGEARDWDVFCLETLPTALGDGAGESWRALLEKAASVKRTASHQRLGEELARPTMTGLALGFAAWLEDDARLVGGKSLEDRLTNLAPELLDRLARKVSQRGRHIQRRAPPDLHALRKSLKRLRYSADYLAGLYPRKAVKPYLKRCRELQDLLGRINDAAVAVTLAEQLSGDGRLEFAPALGALARSAATWRDKAMSGLPVAWDEFQTTPPFWA
jgi:triphosphatase